MSDIDKIETLKKDLIWQLTFEHMDWDYFIETANIAKKIADENEINFTE